MKLRHILIIGTFILINVLIVFALVKGLSKPKEPEEKKIFISTLSATKVENAEKEFKVSGFGNVSSYNAVNVSAEVQGQLSEGKVELKPGIKFAKGDLLFSVYDVDARYALRAKKSQFITLIANILPDIKTDFNSEYLKWVSYIESIKLNAVLPQLPVWKSNKEKIFLSTKNILSEYFSIKSQEDKLNKYYVYAPFTGVIIDVFVNNFSVVNPGAKVLSIVETSNYEIEVSVPVSQIDKVKKGSQATISTTEGDVKGGGTVVRISEVLNKTTQSINVYVKVKSNESEKFIDGEYVSVEFSVADKFSGFYLPSKAVKNNQVYIYSQGDSLIHKKSIVVIENDINGTFVSGLEDDDILITQEVLNHQDSIKYGVIIK